MTQISYPNKCVVIHAGVTYTGKQGPQYTPGVTAQDVGSRNLWFGRVVIPPGGRTRAHRHDAHESAAYVLNGDLAMFHGPELRERDSAGPGDFVFIPAGVPHVVVNRSDSAEAVALLCRTDPNEQESVVLLPELESHVPH